MITPPEWLGRNDIAVREITAHGVATPFEKEYVRKDGRRVPVLVGAAAVPGSPGEVMAFVVDLSGKKAAEREMEHLRTFLDSIVENGKFAGRPVGNPAVVLLDLKMPKMDGLEVLRAMRADPILRPIPVVMLTSSREERDVVESYGLGVNAYVVKPVAFGDFIDAVKQLGLFWAVLNHAPPGSVERAA